MNPHHRFAKRVFFWAGLYGILVLAPLYFMEGKLARDFPPAFSHPEQFYGFLGVALAWQFAFLLIARDPVRYRPLMPITWLEKLSFGAAAVVLMALGRIPAAVFALGCVDLVLGGLFVVAWTKTPRDAG